MSSHHIIRDKQEPALIIANGEECSMDLLEQLLEWSPTVVVLDDAIERVISLGIKVDVWLGDFDHSEKHSLALENYPLKKSIPLIRTKPIWKRPLTICWKRVILP